MKKFIIAGIVLLVIAAVVVFAFANLNGIVNRNKDFILSKAEQAIGRAVSIERIGVTLRGGIGVRLQTVKIADDPAFSNEYFLEASDLRVNVKLWPLLSKRFEVKKAILQAPVIRIVRNEQGILNVSTIGSPSNAREAPGRQGKGSAGSAAAPLIIALVDIDDGVVHYDDQLTKTALSVTRISSRVEDLDFTRPVSVELKAAVFSADQNVRLKGEFGPAGEQLSPETIPLRADIEVDKMDLSGVRAALPQFASRMPAGWTIEGPVSARLHAENVLPSLRVSGTVDGTALSAGFADRFEKAAGVPLVLDFSAHRAGNSIIIDQATLTLNTTTLSGSGEVLTGGTPKYVMNVDAADVDLASLASLVPPARLYEPGGTADLRIRIEGTAGSGSPPGMHGTAALRNGSLKAPQLVKPVTGIEATVTLDGERATVNAARLSVGGSDVEVNASVEQMKPIRMSYRITSARLALDDVRPPNLMARKPEALHQAVVSGTIRMVDRTPVNDGVLTARSGTVANVDFTGLEAAFSIAGKEATFPAITMGALGGTVAGSGTARLDESKPEFSFKSTIRDAEISKLVGLAPKLQKNPLQGTLNLSADLSGSGKEWGDIKTSINGTGLTEVFQGKFLEFNLIDRIFAGLTQYPGLSNLISQRIRNAYPKAFKSRDTEFKNWSSDFVVEQGKLKARNLTLLADDYSVRGKGYLDFDLGLSLSITLSLSRNLSDDLAREVKMLNYFFNDQGQLEIPLQIDGTLPHLQVVADQEYIQRTLQRSLMQQGVDKLKDKGLKDLLPFPRKSADKDTAQGE